MLVIDAGNTHVVVGIYQEEELIDHWRLPTRKNTTSDELQTLLYSLFASRGRSLEDHQDIVICSVVPTLSQSFSRVFKRNNFHFVDHTTKLSFSLDVENPAEMGADRLVNAEAVCHIYGTPAIIIDSGTATTFCVLSKNRVYRGGSIMPGIKVGAEALFERAARLAQVDLFATDHFLGRSTADQLRIGLVNAHALMIDSMICRLKEALGEDKITCVATGGLVHYVQGLTQQIDYFDELLTLKGLRIIGKTLFGNPE